MSDTQSAAGSGVSSPWKNGFFLLFIGASFVSNVGTWLFAVAAGWLMTDLNGSGLSVGLVQTATLLPLVFLAVPGGALGDLINRRKVLLVCQTVLIVVNLVFAYLVMIDAASVGLLLLFTFFNGCGAAIAGPLMTAVIPQLVNRQQLSTAMSINGIAFNASRAVGPILAGWLITAVSIDLPFWIDGVSFAAVVAAVWFWRDDRDVRDNVQPRVFQLALMDSMRFVRYTPALYNSILRGGLFYFGAGALWALLPLVAKDQLGGEADIYGYLVGAAGGGAVISGLVYDRVNALAGGSNRLTVGSSILMGVSLIGLGLSDTVTLGLVAAGVAGACWQLCFTSLITSTQYALPKWFGGRGMAYFFMSMGVSLAVGSALWGWLADLTSLPISHFAAAGTCILLAPLALRYPLDQARDADLDAFTRYPQFDVDLPEESDPGGLLLVRNTYDVPEQYRAEAVKRLMRLRNSRYRSGAVRWHLFRPVDAACEHELYEYYSEVLWTVTERHDQRITKEDEKKLHAFSDWLKEVGGSCARTQFREETAA